MPTSVLKVQPSSTNPDATVLAQRAVQNMGDTGSHANGLETDDQGFIYVSAPGMAISSYIAQSASSRSSHRAEHNGINRFNPRTGRIEPFVRDPAIQVSCPSHARSWTALTHAWLSGRTPSRLCHCDLGAISSTSPLISVSISLGHAGMLTPNPLRLDSGSVLTIRTGRFKGFLSRLASYAPAHAWR